jgi:two-component system cell cycle response regulator
MSHRPPENPSAASAPALPAVERLADGRRWTIAALAAGALVVTLAVAAVAGAGTSPSARALWWCVAALAVAAIVARAAVDPGERRVWVPAAVAFMAWLAGSLYYDDVERLGSPSAFREADLGFLAFALPAAVAFARLAKARIERLHPTILLDGLIVGLAASAVWSGLLAAASSAAARHGDPSPLILAYPATAFGLLAFSAFIVAVCAARSSPFWLLVTGALALLSATGSAFVIVLAHGSYSAGGALGAAWLAGVAAVAAAAWRPVGAALNVSLDPMKRTVVTSGAAVGSLAVLLVALFAEIGPVAECFAALALVAVIGRAAVSLRESVQMFATAREEAITDALTGLGNRRKLLDDLRRELQLASVQSPRVLVIFDLDGFKHYNDTYGHPAGDALLTRLGANLGRAIGPYGHAYRMGGDEFCVLVVTGAPSAKTIIALAASALSEQGEGFAVRSSHGAVILPHEARDATLALRVADQRMYAQKEDRRSSATRQARDILLQVLHEREPELGDHLKGVAKLALGVGTRLDLSGEELDEVVRAAELHDVGKMAIPDEILHKPGPLTAEEWAFVRQHTVIGERILTAAPALMPVAKLVRASHEHFDGSGYPDGLASDAIPLGARIVAVCDAFHAMTRGRPYRPAISAQDALAELQACAGTQFDPAVVSAFCEEIASLGLGYAGRTAASPPATTASRPTP